MNILFRKLRIILYALLLPVFLENTYAANWFNKTFKFSFQDKPTLSENEYQKISSEFETVSPEITSTPSLSDFINWQNDKNLLNKVDQWQSLSQIQIEEKFGNLAYKGLTPCGIRTNEYYVPYNVAPAGKRTVVVVIHGTFVPDTGDYYDPKATFYQYVREFARVQAERDCSPIEVISLRWTGKNISADRQNGAVYLASVLNNLYADAKIITIAHSHGCNLVNCASRMLSPNVLIDHIINIATPVREGNENKFRPLNFKQLTQFYSTGDSIAALGSVTAKSALCAINPWYKGSTRKYTQRDGCRITNIRTQINGQEVGHVDIKGVITYLQDILDARDTHYLFNNDLDLNLDEHNGVLLSIRRPADLENGLKQLQLLDEYGLLEKFVDFSDANSANSINKYVEDKLVQEQQYGQSQENIFKTYYGKEMKSKEWTRFIKGFFKDIYYQFA